MRVFIVNVCFWLTMTGTKDQRKVYFDYDQEAYYNSIGYY